MHPEPSDAPWQKSTYSGDASCVELAALADGSVAVRDSKHPGGGALRFTPTEIDAFVRGVKAGEFDHLAG